MTSLVCFEAAARHHSFKLAASELSVTPAAVSHQIKGLETELSRPLFRRQFRGVELTEAGAVLFVAIQRGFQAMSEAVQEIRARAEAEDVVVQVTTAMSAFWLTPQIAAFWNRHPDIVVSQLVSDVEPAAGWPDISIHYGNIPDDGGEYRFLFRDRIVALGTPDYAAAQNITAVTDLLRAPLIHLNAQETGWTGWNDWFGALGHDAPKGRRLAVNNYMIALQMAQDGIGAVLGWDGLVGQIVAQGRLIQLVPESLSSPQIFFLKVHPRASHKARIFCDWLVALHKG